MNKKAIHTLTCRSLDHADHQLHHTGFDRSAVGMHKQHTIWSAEHDVHLEASKLLTWYAIANGVDVGYLGSEVLVHHHSTLLQLNAHALQIQALCTLFRASRHAVSCAG
jgi:hypothetical protein